MLLDASHALVRDLGGIETQVLALWQPLQIFQPRITYLRDSTKMTRLILINLVVAFSTSSHAAPSPVVFEQSAHKIDAFDFVEVIVRVAGPAATNPFSDVAVTGQFQQDSGSPVKVDGFCDSPDGSFFRIRFMPAKPEQYSYTVVYRQGDQQQMPDDKDLPSTFSIEYVRAWKRK